MLSILSIFDFNSTLEVIRTVRVNVTVAVPMLNDIMFLLIVIIIGRYLTLAIQIKEKL